MRALTPEKLGQIAYEAECESERLAGQIYAPTWDDVTDKTRASRIAAAQAVKEALESWISVSDGVPFVDHDNNYERNYTRVLAQMDNDNVREIAYVEEGRGSEGFWLETNGKKPSGRVLRWMYMPPTPRSEAEPC